MVFDCRREVGVWNPQIVPRSTIFLSSFIETSLVEGEKLMGKKDKAEEAFSLSCTMGPGIISGETVWQAIG